MRVRVLLFPAWLSLALVVTLVLWLWLLSLPPTQSTVARRRPDWPDLHHHRERRDRRRWKRNADRRLLRDIRRRLELHRLQVRHQHDRDLWHDSGTGHLRREQPRRNQHQPANRRPLHLSERDMRSDGRRRACARLPHRLAADHGHSSDATAGLGSAYDLGMDPGVYVANGPAGVIVQNEAFTCNIVAATIVQCVKGPAYSHGAFSSIGQWASGATLRLTMAIRTTPSAS